MSTNAPIQYIQQCMSQGFSQKQIADSLGCTEAYVSQLVTEHAIAPAANTQFEDHDDHYRDIELLALKRLKRAVQTDPSLNALALARIATQLNGTKRRSQNELPVASTQAPVVHLHLPNTVAAQFVFNGTNEAVAINDAASGTRVLSTATSQQVAQLASQKLAQRAIGGTNHAHSVEVLPDAAI